MKCHCLGLHCLSKYLLTTTVLPVPRQLKFTKVIQACVYYCVLHIKCLNRAEKDQTEVYVCWFQSGR